MLRHRSYSRRIEKVLRRWLALPYYLCSLRLTALYYFFTSPTIEELNESACQAVIAPTSKRKLQRAYDRHMCKWRHLVENVFCDLKEFKKIAMPSEKTDRSFAANIYLAATIMALR